ncbi:hypothetical protein SIL80_12375 [Bacillus cereus group sp. BfR-BA-01119]|uniref:hypothetical protein n=1 Tax=Bacillus cereus group TaxID=86661 RepID=UPI00298C1303|nr:MULTISPECIES: hypothetical protein [Bacillus cereus group]MDX5866680.1 hypothetical protein [Bacillus cereus group sp. BfR-BA-01119]MDX5908878.1 hypothetical protein [Bacillus cereus group sp. BfR-BA-01029]
MSFINSFFEKKAEPVQRLFFDIRFLFFGFTLISSLGFLIIYSFLYGYYFSGDEFFQISNFNIVSNLIPFSIQTLTITSIFFICIYYIISASIPLMRKNKEKKGAIFILLVLIIFLLNLFITMFFANEITFISMLSFAFIWIFVGFTLCFLYTINIAEKHPILMISAAVLQFLLLAFIGQVLSVMKVLDESIYMELSTVLFIPCLLITLIIFRHYHSKKWFNSISCLPFSIIISMLLSLGLGKNNIVFLSEKAIFIATMPILHFAILKIVKLTQKKIEKKVKLGTSRKIQEKQEENKEKSFENNSILYIVIYKCYSILSNKANNVVRLVIGLVLLFAFVSLPRFSLWSGQFIRIINQPFEKPIKITYVNQSGKESNLVGNYYIENNSILYISNRCWDLEVIKPINYHIKPIDKENKQSCEKKDPTV